MHGGGSHVFPLGVVSHLSYGRACSGGLGRPLAAISRDTERGKLHY